MASYSCGVWPDGRNWLKRNNPSTRDNQRYNPYKRYQDLGYVSLWMQASFFLSLLFCKFSIIIKHIIAPQTVLLWSSNQSSKTFISNLTGTLQWCNIAQKCILSGQPNVTNYTALHENIPNSDYISMMYGKAFGGGVWSWKVTKVWVTVALRSIRKQIHICLLTSNHFRTSKTKHLSI